MRKLINRSMQHVFLSGMKKKDKSRKLCLLSVWKRQVGGRRLEGGCGRFSYKKEKVVRKERLQHVSRSGEKGERPRTLCAVGKNGDAIFESV